eukprot:2941885-Rhodomonas_salina.1
MAQQKQARSASIIHGELLARCLFAVFQVPVRRCRSEQSCPTETQASVSSIPNFSSKARQSPGSHRITRDRDLDRVPSLKTRLASWCAIVSLFVHLVQCDQIWVDRLGVGLPSAIPGYCGTIV